MRFPCRIARSHDGSWQVHHASRQLGEFDVTAPTREQALSRMVGELRYRLEMCPCSGELYQDVEIELVDAR